MKRSIKKSLQSRIVKKIKAGIFFPAGHILDLDHGFAKSHLEDVVESFRRYIIEYKTIDGGITPLLQFIDINMPREIGRLYCKWN